MKPLMNIILVCALICFIALDLQAKTAGSLVLETGIVKLRRNYTDRIIRVKGQEILLNEKDEIQTAENTKVRLFLRQKKESILLYSNSFFTIAEVNEEKSELSFPIGKVRCRIKPTFSKVNKSKRRFRLRTVTALIGVKGTDFVVETTGTETSVLTLEGSVDFANITMPDVVVEVAENQASKATKTEAPSPPVEVPEEAREKITSEDTGQKWEGVDSSSPEEPKKKPEEKKPKEESKGKPSQQEPPAEPKTEDASSSEVSQPTEETPVEEQEPETVEEPVVEDSPVIDIPIDTLPTIPDDPGEVKEEADSLGEAVDQTVIITIQEQ